MLASTVQFRRVLIDTIEHMSHVLFCRSPSRSNPYPEQHRLLLRIFIKPAVTEFSPKP